MNCIPVLLPALIRNQEEQDMTQRAFKSIVSLEHCVKVELDTNKYRYAVAEVWNVFLDRWRGKEYDHIMIAANDLEFDPMAIDFMVRAMHEYPNAGLITCKVERDYDAFKAGFGQQIYNPKLTVETQFKRIDPAAFIMRKGVIEKVGRIDQQFPLEFVERDYMHRVKLAGWDVIQLDTILCYHPNHSGTIGNSDERLLKYLDRYTAKWGGDTETYKYPYNDLSLDFTYCLL